MAEDTKQQDNQLQPEAPTSNKRIAKNALMLYIRMFLTMIVGLYTSRVVLATLGVEDYGIYGVVGGVVAMMGFLNASMSGATSRFLTFELGRGDQKRLADTFSSALIVHIGIALVVFVLAETIGLWFLCNKLVIPAGRMEAAHWVYQCSILSAMLGITQAPYNASIIAHEKMDVYAYVEILNVTLKLLIVYLLVIGNFDKLKLYAILVLAVSVIIMLIYRIYCIRKFKETHFHWLWNKEILKPLLSFSGWNIFGNFGNVAWQQGINIVANLFLGVIVNAAIGISTTVSNVVNLFSSNIVTAFRPAITKQYAKDNIDEMSSLLIFTIKITLVLFMAVAIPMSIEVDYILNLWLITPPEYSNLFIQCILMSILFETIRYILNIPVHAQGNIKYLGLYTGIILVCVPIALYILLSIKLTPTLIFIPLIIAQFILSILNMYLIKHQIPNLLIKPILIEILKIFFLSSIVYILITLIIHNVHKSFIRLTLTCCIDILSLGFLSYVFVLNKKQRQIITSHLKTKRNE